ncbi:MAG TPA: phospholipid scramblase-related protein [Frankiaceae bacterium]|nr:phospholipid scramblase-related protein [Frankiaceae bacterium]
MTETPSQPPAGWYPDPTSQFEQRYWDGAQWTEHVSTAGQQSTSPLAPMAAPVTVSKPEKVQRQVQKQAGITEPVPGGGGTIFDTPVLVVNQKAKLIELTNEYAVYDAHGTQLGSVVQVGQGTMRKAIRLLTQYDQFLSHRLEVRDANGRVVLGLHRPAKFMKSRVIVSGPNGNEIGQIRQENAIGKIRFAFEVAGERVGGIQAENWRAWDFAINDAQGAEVARIKKTFEGLAKAMFTTADNYVVRIHRQLDEPLRTLVVAAAVSVDTALKQDDR